MAIAALPASLRAAVTRRRRAPQRVLPSQSAIRALGDAILPAELGGARREIASDAFWRWMEGYHPGAELLHPYGSPAIAYTPESPVPRWMEQLQALDREARTRHGAAFAGLTREQREALVRAALNGAGERLPGIAAAPHVALALLAHFYVSPEATDLCYEAQIGRTRCRPLVHNPRRPLPLAPS